MARVSRQPRSLARWALSVGACFVMIGLTSCPKRGGGQCARCVSLVSLGATYMKLTPLGSGDLVRLTLMAVSPWPMSAHGQAFAEEVDRRLTLRLSALRAGGPCQR